jgi:hypothetical protein
MIKLLLILLLISTGCAKVAPKDDNRSYPLVDEGLLPFFTEFLEDAHTYNKTIDLSPLYSVTFEKLDLTVGGICYSFRDKYGDITSSKVVIASRFKSANKYRLKSIVYHELGHCLLGYGHSTASGDLMYLKVLKTDYLRDNWPRLVKDLFDKGREQR